MARQDYIKGGGTSTAANDELKARERAQAERGQAEQDRMMQAASGTREESRDADGVRVVKTSSDPDVQHYAALYSRNLGGLDDHATIVLRAENQDHTVLDYIICNLLVDSDGSLKLVMICPSCLHKHQKGVRESHITLHSSNRPFSLHDRHRGALWVNPKNPSEAYHLAGSIETHAPVPCPTCAFRFEIGPARSEPGEPPVSGAVRAA